MTVTGSIAARTTKIITALASGWLTLFVSVMAHGEPAGLLFLPSEVKSPNGRVHSFTTLSNEDLLIRADQMKHDRITPSQRAMNYQWLSEHSGSEDAIHGDKAVSKLVERHLKAYLDERGGSRWLENTLLPESSDRRFIKGVDYDVKLRANRMVIGVSYEF